MENDESNTKDYSDLFQAKNRHMFVLKNKEMKRRIEKTNKNIILFFEHVSLYYFHLLQKTMIKKKSKQ